MFDRLANNCDGDVKLLLRWCQVVYSSFDLGMDNFTSLFSDGRVPCHLIHYYHPGILRREDIVNKPGNSGNK